MANIQEKYDAFVQHANDGDLSEVNKALLHGIPVNCQESKGKYTALIKACRMQRFEVVQTLLDNKADVHLVSKNGWSALIEACRVGNQPLAELLLEIPGINMVHKNKMGWTCLVEACRNNHVHIVQLLADRGINVVTVDKDGLIPKEHTSNPDIYAILDKAWEAQLVRDGKDVEAAKKELELKKKKIEERIEDKLVNAAYDGKLELVSKLLDQGVDIDAESTNGAYTPLIMACRMEHPEVVKLLLERKADINKHSTTGWTPMIEACRVGCEKVMHILYEWEDQKVDINKRQEFGWPPITEACRNSHYEIVEQLVEWGADVTEPDGDGDIPIDHSTHPWIIDMLKNNVKYGKHNPRSRMKIAFTTAFNERMDYKNRQPFLFQTIHEIERDVRERSDEDKAEIYWTIFSSVLEEMDVSFMAELLSNKEAVRAAVISRKLQFFESLLSLPLPDEEDKEEIDRLLYMTESEADPDDSPRQYVIHFVNMINVVLENLWPPENRSSYMAQFIDNADEKQRTPVLIAAGQFEAEVVAAVKRKDKQLEKGLPWQAMWYFDLMLRILYRGANLNVVDLDNNTVFLHVLRPIGAARHMPNVVSHIIQEFDVNLWSFFVRPPHPDMTVAQMQQFVTENEIVLIDSFKKPKALRTYLNVGDEHSFTAIAYLVYANEHQFDLRLLLALIEDGASLPTAKVPRQRLMTILGGLMDTVTGNPASGWRIARAAVRNADLGMVQAIIDEKIPLFFTNPEPSLNRHKRKHRNLTHTKNHEFATKNTSYESECLFHMAIEQGNSDLCKMLLEYGSRPPSQFSATYSVMYPWPDYTEVVQHEQQINQREFPINLCVAWRNSLGRTSFHIIANRKTKAIVRKMPKLFRDLLEIDTSAVITRPDRYGWCPIHYAAFHNKLELITILIENHVNLRQPTYFTGTHDMGRTALHLAAMQGHWAVVLSMLEGDIDIEPVDRAGCTPLALAMMVRQKLFEEDVDEEEEANFFGALLPKSIQEVLPDELLLVNKALGKAAKKLGITRGASFVGKRVAAAFHTAKTRVSQMGHRLANETRKRLGSSTSDRELKEEIELATNPGLLSATDKPMVVEEEKLPQRGLGMTIAFDKQAKVPGPASRPSIPVQPSDRSIDSDEEEEEGQIKFKANVGSSARKKETYNMAIQALLNAGASIETAAKQSGKDLKELMNVDDKWFTLCREMYVINVEVEDTIDQYYDFIDKRRGPELLDERAEKRKNMLREVQVLESRKHETFNDKERQMVIKQKYNEHIRNRHFMKLIRYVVFLIFLSLLGIWQSTQDKTSAYLMHRAVEVQLPTDIFDFEISGIPKSFAMLDEDKEEFYLFLLGPFINSVYPDAETQPKYWQGSTLTPVTGVLANYNYILGTPRFRQVRSRTELCDIPSEFLTITPVCFSKSTNPTDIPFGPQQPNGALRYQYASSDQLGGVPIWGRVDAYDGGGFPVELPSPYAANARSIANATFLQLQNDNWIDAATRAVFIDMTLYNPNVNQFMLVSLLLEFPVAGGIVSSWELLSTKLKRDISALDDGALVLEWVVVIMLLLHFHSEVAQMVTSRLGYLNSLWNWLDMTIILLSPPLIVLRLMEASQLDGINFGDTTMFLHTHRLARLQYIENILFSIVILVSWLKLFDYLSVFENLYRMVIMILAMASKLKDWTIVYCLMIAGYTSAEYVAYGYLDKRSYTWFRGFVYRAIGVFAGEFEFLDHTEVHRVLGTVFTITFVIINGMLLLNLIIALLSSGYEDAANATSDELARLQYEKLEDEGYTKLKRLVLKRRSRNAASCTERIDDAALVAGRRFRLFMKDFWYRCRARVRRRYRPKEVEDVSSHGIMRAKTAISARPRFSSLFEGKNLADIEISSSKTQNMSVQ